MKVLAIRRQPPTGRHPERSSGSLRPGRSEEPSPRDSAGAEEGGAILTETWAEAVGVIAPASHQTASARYFQRFFTPFPPAFARREFRSE